jgi:hypothetical protein
MKARRSDVGVLWFLIGSLFGCFLHQKATMLTDMPCWHYALEACLTFQIISQVHA